MSRCVFSLYIFGVALCRHQILTQARTSVSLVRVFTACISRLWLPKVTSGLQPVLKVGPDVTIAFIVYDWRDNLRLFVLFNSISIMFKAVVNRKLVLRNISASTGKRSAGHCLNR